MKRYAILTVVVLAVLVVAWTAFGQEEEGAERSQRMKQTVENMSGEELVKFYEEYKEQLRAIVLGDDPRRSRMSREDTEKAIKMIEAQVPKLKAATPVIQGGFQDGTIEEYKNIGDAYIDRRTALEIIILQVVKLQGWRQSLEEGERLLIISTNELKQIQDAATKEKAKETSQLLERLIARGDRHIGRRRRSNQPQSDQQR